MPLSDSAPQLNFLKESADSLHSLSPSTAAHLLTVHNHILHSHFKPLNQKQRDSFCGACGNIRTAEWTKTTDSRVSKRTSGGRATVYECLRCHRRMVKPLRREPVHPSTTEPRAAPAVQTSTSKPTSTSTSTPLTPPAPQQGSGVAEGSKAAKSAENASSKKRAKARKGGLQALLASKQQSQQSSLDLFDFLQ